VALFSKHRVAAIIISAVAFVAFYILFAPDGIRDRAGTIVGVGPRRYV